MVGWWWSGGEIKLACCLGGFWRGNGARLLRAVNSSKRPRLRLKNHGDWRIEKWVVESSTHDEATKQPGHVMMVQPRFSIELFNHHDSSALTIGNHLVYGMKCFKAMNWVQEDYTRGSKTILEVKSQFPSMLVPAACFDDFWCAKLMCQIWILHGH